MCVSLSTEDSFLRNRSTFWKEDARGSRRFRSCNGYSLGSFKRLKLLSVNGTHDKRTRQQQKDKMQTPEPPKDEFVGRNLFGGAIQCYVPARFVDVR